MESVSFSSTTEDDDTTEIEQHYEEKIRQLQNEGLQLHQFYVKKCDANKQLSLQNRDLQKQVADLQQKLCTQKDHSSFSSPTSTTSLLNDVSSPLSAINFIKSQVQQMYDGSDSKCCKLKENREKLREKCKRLKSELDNGPDMIIDPSVDEDKKINAIQNKSIL